MDYKSFFDIPENVTYINTPGNGLMPRKHHEWRQTYGAAFFDANSDLRDQHADFIKKVKEGAGTLFNCPTENIYALPNFSFGYNTLLTGLPQNMKIAILQEDYPSLNYPIISRGFEHLFIQSNENIEENILSCIEQHNPDILALSIVNYITGLKINLELIVQLKEQYPDLIIIGDATQYLGTEPFDFMHSGFDAVGMSGYKWMMAGFGNGLLFLSDTLKSILFAKAQQGARPKEAMWANKSILDTFFEPGHQDTFSHGAMLQSIQFFQEQSLDKIAEHIQKIAAYAHSTLQERKLLLPSIEKRATRSSLINIQINPKHYPLLMQEGIKCFPRGTGIRIGLHLYNNTEDINTLLNTIDTII